MCGLLKEASTLSSRQFVPVAIATVIVVAAAAAAAAASSASKHHSRHPNGVFDILHFSDGDLFGLLVLLIPSISGKVLNTKRKAIGYRSEC